MHSFAIGVTLAAHLLNSLLPTLSLLWLSLHTLALKLALDRRFSLNRWTWITNYSHGSVLVIGLISKYFPWPMCLHHSRYTNPPTRSRGLHPCALTYLKPLSLLSLHNFFVIAKWTAFLTCCLISLHCEYQFCSWVPLYFTGLQSLILVSLKEDRYCVTFNFVYDCEHKLEI